MLTETELTKLANSAPVRDKANDYIVRKKLQKWLDGLPIVYGYILRYLPERQIKRIITSRQILNMIDILLHLFSMMTVPMIKKNEYEYTAIPLSYPPRRAEKEEVIFRDSYLKPLLHALFRLLSAEDVREVMQAELSQNQPDYIIVKKAFDKYPSGIKEEPTNSSKTQIIIY